MARNPAIIYGGLHGYDEDGPYVGLPAYDDVIQGQSGLADMFARRGGAPMLMPSVIADKTAALLATSGILAAIIRRLCTGKGVYVETLMFEGLTAYTLLEHQHGAMFAEPGGTYGYPRAMLPARRPHRTTNGYICMLAYTDAQWTRFWKLTGNLGLTSDPRFKSMNDRARNIDDIYRLAGMTLATKSTEEWLGLLKQAEIPSSAVNRLEDLAEDEHLKAVNFFRAFHHPSEWIWNCPKQAPNSTANPCRCDAIIRGWESRAVRSWPRPDCPRMKSTS